ncbi:thiazole biosynthesis protein [Escherichia coli]
MVEEANNVDIREIAKQKPQEVVEVETGDGFGPNDVVLDIRSIDEQEDNPLKVEGIDVVSLPFYKLSTKFGETTRTNTGYCRCERGVMSRLQALCLREQGFNNVKVYRPVICGCNVIWSDATLPHPTLLVIIINPCRHHQL